MDCKRTPVLDDNTLKLAERTPAARLQDPNRPSLDDPADQLAHEIGKLSFRQLIVKWLVRHRGAEQRIEMPLDVGQGLHAGRRTAREHAHRQTIRGDDPLALAKACQPTQRVDAALREHPLELADEVAKLFRSHSSLHYVMVLPSFMIGDFGWDFKIKYHVDQ